MGYVKKFQIPAHDEMPSDEMIEWLHSIKQEWDGDESGITVLIGTTPEVDTVTRRRESP